MSSTPARQPPPNGQSVLRWVKVSGREYPVTVTTTCRVCTAPPTVRTEIERALLAGYRYGKISDSVERLAQQYEAVPPSAESIRQHVAQQHMTLPQQMQRELIEARATKLGRDIERGEGSLVDYIAVNESIIQRGFERVSSGDITPTMNELLQALKLQAQIEAQSAGGSVSTEAYQEALMEYLRLARQYMPPDAWRAFGEALADSPILKAIAERYERQQQELP